MEEEISLLKKQKALIKQALQTTVNENTELQKIKEELEARCKLQANEIDSLNLLNQQLSKRCENLQEESKSKSQGSWSTWGLWKSKGANKLEELTNQLTILQEELDAKIKENEQVHMTNFYLKEKSKKKKADWREIVGKKDEFMRNMNEQIEDMQSQINSQKTQIQQLNKERNELSALIQVKNKELQESQANFHKINSSFQEKTNTLENKLRTKVSLDDTGFEFLSCYNAPKFNFSYTQKQCEWIAKAKSSLSQICPHISDICVKYSTRLQFLYENSNPSYRRILAEFQKRYETFLENFSIGIKELTMEKLDANKVIKSVDDISRNYKALLSILILQLQQEGKWVEDSAELNSLNQELIDCLKKIDSYIGRGLAFVIASSYGKHSCWDLLQDLTKNLVQSITKCSNFWGKRLALDTKLRYKITVKSTRSINDEILGSLQALCSVVNHICSALLQLKSNLYFNTSQLYFNSVSYLTNLREISYTPGIEYSKAIQNVQDLKLSERKIDEQRLQIQRLEKELEKSQTCTEKANNEVRQLQNILVAIEQNAEKSEEEVGKNIFQESEPISEDVKNGAQKVALRLTDSNGEPVPISTLNVESDLYEKIKEVAILQINKLAEKVNNNEIYMF
ncbi:unnamed protein product [Blepharisma stoltei]|uniref:Uncharacterized protein n=1 Tax=Blepharisma stoltei TaxID=1481888 RepID=A0AAU9JTN0_9CILI|nr:unnamed protein product [Blepharisma stoltei]